MVNTYDLLLNPPPLKPAKAIEKALETSLLANQQSSKAEKQQASQVENQQTSESADQQSRKTENQPTRKPENAQTSKPLKKFASYLAEDLFYELKAVALQLRKKEYEVLQEAVEAYVQKQKSS